MATTIANLTAKADGSMEGVFATLRVNAVSANTGASFTALTVMARRPSSRLRTLVMPTTPALAAA